MRSQRELYLAYQRDLRAFAGRLTRTRDDAEELVAATFATVPSASALYRGEANELKYLLGICANLARKQRRSAARRARALEGFRQLSPNWDEGDPETLLIRAELASAAKQALLELPREQRSALLLAVEGRSSQESAAIEGVPPGTIRTRLFHARKKVLEALGRRGVVAVSLCVLLVSSWSLAQTHAARVAWNWLKQRVTQVAPVPKPRVERRSPINGALAASAVARQTEADAQPPDALTDATAAPTVMQRAAPDAPTVMQRAAPRVPVAKRPAAPKSSQPLFQPKPQELELYARAHALHFQRGDFAGAVPAWEKYLEAAPTGELRLEARYNLVLALFELRRASEARPLLEILAREPSYRQPDATLLLGRLTDAEPSATGL